ncbi:MAG: hypothetical protein OIF36_04085 [Alphaproteobacteria bacterium]|nr:hypothetical protein [Alphaproteobacteria bacterium]
MKKNRFVNILINNRKEIFIPLIIVILSFLIWNWLNIDSCLDSGYCKEGLELNTEYGLITINQENCQKYNWIWHDEKKICEM